jgi:hypothetical protein
MRNDSDPDGPPFPSSYCASGLLLHVTSLPSPYGADVGPTATAWIDQLNEAGQSWCLAFSRSAVDYNAIIQFKYRLLE